MSTTTVAIFGATGNQGGSVVRSLAESRIAERLEIKAFTRDPTSGSSQKLTSLQTKAKILPTKVDLDDIVSKSGNPFNGVNIVFANTNTFDGGAELEVKRGKAIIDAAKEARVELFIWSTLPSAKDISNGKYTQIEHFEAKAQITEYLRASGLKWTALSPGWFAENIKVFHMAEKNGANAFKINYSVMKPDVKIGWTWVERDFGNATEAVIVAHILGENAAVFNRIVPACGYSASMQDLIDVVARKTGKAGSYNELPPFDNTDLDDMHRFYNDYGLYGDVELPDPELVKLGVKFSTLEDAVDALALPQLA